MNTPLSNVDLNNAIKQFDSRGANYFNDSDIKPNTNIETVFKDRGHTIIFHKYKDENVGHWYCLLRDNNNIFYCDSFGENPDFYCKNMIPFLKNNGIKNIIINKEVWQNTKSSICGRYGLVLCTIHKFNPSINEIYKFMENGKKKYKSYDKFILNLTT